jgi:hypothetical protein
MTAQKEFVLLDSQQRLAGGHITLCGHKTASVVKAYREALCGGQMEEAIHWSGELVISGDLWKLWETVFTVTALHYYTHRQMTVYLADRYKRFRRAATGTADIELRNNAVVRSIIAEVSAVVASGDRRFRVTRTPITDDMFSVVSFRTRLKASSRDIGSPFIHDSDPPEAAMCANELAFALKSQRLSDAQFWVEWLLALQRRCAKQKQPCICGERGSPDATLATRTSPALLLWSVLQGIAGDDVVGLTVSAWEELFMVKYTTKVNTSRTMLLLAATYAVCNRDTLVNTAPVPNAKMIPAVVQGLSRIYQRLAKQSKLEYLTDAQLHVKSQTISEPTDDGHLLQLLTPVHPRTE